MSQLRGSSLIRFLHLKQRMRRQPFNTRLKTFYIERYPPVQTAKLRQFTSRAAPVRFRSIAAHRLLQLGMLRDLLKNIISTRIN